jgi:hypothetical protein
MNPSTDLQFLASQHAAAKEKEAFAKAERQRIEDQIVAITGLKDHGQKTVAQANCKITVKPNFSYSLDLAEWDKLAPTFPVALVPYRIKIEPNEAKIRAIKADHPDLYARLSAALTVKPNRPTVEIAWAE